MRVLRENRDLLKTVLETFVHDPLCEWSRKSSAKDNGEVHLRTIYNKLNGRVTVGLPLGIEGQVDDLIDQARDVTNLSKMYIGWAAYM